MDDAPPVLVVSAPTPLGAVGGSAIGVAKGLGIGVLGGAACYASLGGITGGCVAAVMTPYWISRGAVEGATKAAPQAERSESLATITEALKEADQPRLVLAIEKESTGRTAQPPEILPALGISAKNEYPIYHYAAGRNVDTVAEVTLLRVGLESPPACGYYSSNGTPQTPCATTAKWWEVAPSVNPDLAIVVEARLRLVSATENKIIVETTYLHRSEQEKKFTDWGRDGASEFRNARDETLDTLGRCIALEIFGPAEPPRDSYLTRCKDEL